MKSYHHPNYPLARLRNEALRKLAEQHPELSCSMLGLIFKVSRQYALKVIGKRPFQRQNGKN